MSKLYKTQNYLAPDLVVEHDIDSDNISVYDAWTELELFQKWFYPTGFTIAKAEMMPEVGGYFKIHMKAPDGKIYPTIGEYILLEKPHRIVYRDSWDDEREDNDPVITEVVFEEHGTNTKLKLYSSFATEEQKENILSSGVIDGWKMFFENLNKLLKSTS